MRGNKQKASCTGYMWYFSKGLVKVTYRITADHVLMLIFSVTHCLNLIEELIENPTCDTDWFIMPLVNPEGYDYSYNSDRAWIKNRQDNGNSVCQVRNNNLIS